MICDTLVSGAEAFLKLMTWEWADRVSTVALQALQTNKHNKLDLLPVTEDLVKLHDHVRKICMEKSRLMMGDETKRTMQNWRELAEAALCWITLFNKRRGNEVAMMRVKSYLDRPNWREAANQEITGSFTETEKQMLDR